MKYVHRWLEARIQEALNSHPVIVLTGPRQVGKSTLLEHAGFLKDWHYLTLDDPDMLEQAKEDPKGLLREDQPTIIDEVQRCPELLLTVKYLVDRSGRRRNFILSGSGNVSLRQSPRETLAGRAKYLHMTGFAYREMKGQPPHGLLDCIWNGREIKAGSAKPGGDMLQAIWKGSLPAVALASSRKIAMERLSGYIDTYIRRDIQDLVKVRYPQHFRRLMEVLAQATGWESVQEQLSNACGETRSNVSRYMSMLKETSLLHEIKGYTVKNERAYKQSKYYWFDSGVACFLSGMQSPPEVKAARVKGRFFENFILQQILAWAALQLFPPEIFYWKPKAQESEIDFIIMSAGRGVAVETKSASQIRFGDTKPMREFLKSHPQVASGIMVYSGDRVYQVATNIYAVPWSMV